MRDYKEETQINTKELLAEFEKHKIKEDK